MEEISRATSVNIDERRVQVEELVTNLIQGYQLIADIFLATYGMKVTEKLYHEILFGSRESK
jgi:hypothetical protein